MNEARTYGVSPAYYATAVAVCSLLMLVLIVIFTAVHAVFAFMNQFSSMLTGPGAQDVSQRLGMQLMNLVLFAPIVALLLMIVAGRNARYCVTRQEIHIQYATFRKLTQRLPLINVQDVSAHQTFWGRIVGYGDVLVQTAGSTTALPIRYVSKPHEVADHIHQLAKESRTPYTPSPWEF